jgi:hypothetical protein
VGTQHSVVVGDGGRFAPTGADGTVPADVDAIVAGLRERSAGKVVLHFHGGLVPRAKGLDLATRLERVYVDSGTQPVIVVWESGLLETVTRNLRTLNQTQMFNKLVDLGIRHLAKLLGAGAGTRGPGALMSLDEVRAARASDAELERMDVLARGAGPARTEADVVAQADEVELELQLDLEADRELGRLVSHEELEGSALDEELAASLGGPEARGPLAVITLARLIRGVVIGGALRFVRGRDHGVIATVVEEVLRAAYLANAGAWVWSGMKTASEAMWRDDAPADGTSAHVGSYLLEQLARLQGERAGLAIDLVGHSAGSIVIGNLLEATAVRHRDLRFRNLLLLAPAITVDRTFTQIQAHVDRFDAFRMFTMEDALECRDRLVPGVYPRSLLYFVSGALECEPDEPLLGLRRHTTGLRPYDGDRFVPIRRYLEADPARLVLSRTPDSAPAGRRSVAAKHGDFDDDAVTLESLAAIVGR